MSDQRMTRRLAGYLGKRFSETRMDLVADPRDPRGRRWSHGALLSGLLLGLVGGCRSLADVEDFTERLGSGFRALFRIGRRIPDTTLRDLIVQTEPRSLRPMLHRVLRAAYRRGALEPDGLPFGVLSLDGKVVTLRSTDDGYAQRQGDADSGEVRGLLRTVTATLTSSRARPCIDVTPVLASTNEMGTFQTALGNALDAYGSLDLFRLVTYDAGACSLDNAAFARSRGVHYLLGLKSVQPTLYREASLWLGSRAAGAADAETEDIVGKKRVVRRLYLGAAVSAPEGWESHLRAVLRVQTVTYDLESGNQLGDEENRYFVSSLASDRLRPEQWLLVIRRHWGIETSHQILDDAFAEDAHPWIVEHPRAALVMVVLRRLAYTLMTLFRSVTQRSERRRERPWKRLLDDVRQASWVAPRAWVASLRHHHIPSNC